MANEANPCSEIPSHMKGTYLDGGGGGGGGGGVLVAEVLATLPFWEAHLTQKKNASPCNDQC